MALAQGDIRRWVFPLVATRPAALDPEGIEVEFRGTGFMLRGLGGLAVTAHHVADALGETPAAMLLDEIDGRLRWFPLALEVVDRHPTEDVAYLRLDGGEDRGSPLCFDRSPHGPSLPWRTFGYPSDVQNELTGPDGRVMPTMDLVYTQGYVRRTITGRPLPGLRSHRSSELSAPPGSGCSGSPMMLRRVDGFGGWPVIGVVIGQRHNETEGLRVGYAVRIENDPWFRESPSPSA